VVQVGFQVKFHRKRGYRQIQELYQAQKLSQLQFQEAQAKAQGSATPFWDQNRLPNPVRNQPGAFFKKPSN
jgi:hypothetical protein